MSAIDRKLMRQAPTPLEYPASSSGAGAADRRLTAAGSPRSVVISPAVETWSLWPYIQLARVDHWFKSVFMVLGVVLALFYEPALFAPAAIVPLAIAVLATCVVASSNYVLNEMLDAATDRAHPTKRLRPAAAGLVRPSIAYAEWLLVGAAGLAIASAVNPMFAASASALWIMGVLYNVPPIRMKEWPYVDVLSESVNNALRLLLGWFALIPDRVPPVSLVIAYWMVGAFFMATKRLAEYRYIGNPTVAAAYRRSFRHYTEERLIVSIVFYATTCALFAGIFIVRYHLELILFVPAAAGVLAYYLRIGLQPDSPIQNPEKLYKERKFFAYITTTFVLFVLLMFTRVPALYDWFNVEPSRADPLWTVGAASPR